MQLHGREQVLLAEDAAAAPAKKKKKKKKKKGMSKEEMIRAAGEAQAAARAALEQGLSHEDAGKMADQKLKVLKGLDCDTGPSSTMAESAISF